VADASLPYDERAKSTFLLGAREARSMGHAMFSSEHLLLGIIAVGEGSGWEALRDFSVDLEQVRTQVAKLIGTLPPLPPDQKLAPTPAASKVIRQSSVEVEMLGHDVIGTEHLLLAITRSENVAVAVLEKLGVDPAPLRVEVIRVLGS
jgi:ATP-dependent Clp protease ATP-binding subunit ClpC